MKQRLHLISLAYLLISVFAPFIIQAQTISSGAIAENEFCAGSYVSVPFTITGTFNSGNVFTAQLSNATGSFALPVGIGTFASTAAGTISANIPINTPSGAGYLIRVVSSNPPVTGSATTSAFTVDALTGNTFQNNYAGSASNSYYEGAHAVIQLSDSNYAALGYGLNLFKINPSGNILWAKQIFDQNANNTSMEGDDIRQTSDGGFIIGATPSYGPYPYINYMYLVKTDASGNTEWANYYGNTNVGGWEGGGIGTELCSVRQTSDGGYIVSGLTSAFGLYWDGEGGHPLIMKVDAGGNVLWTQIFSELDVNFAWIRSGVDVEEIPGSSGDLMIWVHNTGYNCCSGTSDSHTGGFLVRTHSDGTVVWSEVMSGVSGTSENMDTTSGGFYLGVAYGISSSGGVIKVDYNGNVLWSAGINTNEYLQSIASTADGGCVLSHGMLNYDAGLVKLSSTGAIQWAEDYTSGSMQFAMDVVQTKDGGYLVQGTEGAVSSGTDMCLVKTDTAGNAGGTETAMSYTATNVNLTTAAYTPAFGSYTITKIQGCAVTSNFNPSVTSFTGGGTCTLNEMVYNINSCNAPQVNFSANEVVVCAGSAVNFTGLFSDSATSWNWIFTGGTPGTSTSQNPQVMYDTSGNYNVTLIVTTTGASDTLTKTAYITVNSGAATGIVTANPDSVCAGSSSQLTLTGSAGSIQWQASTDTVLFSNISSATSAAYNTPVLNQTTYYRVEVTGQCGTDSSGAVAVFVTPVPVSGAVTASPDTLCAGSATQLTSAGVMGSFFQWQSAINGGNYSNINNADNAIFNTSPIVQSASYRLVVNNGVCADTSAPVAVLVNPAPVAPALTTNDSIICSSDSTQINTTGSYASYLWNTTETSSSIWVHNAGDYSVTVTDMNSCSAASGQQKISVYPVTSVSIDVLGDTLASFNASHYQWFFNDSAIQGANAAIYVAQHTGNYAVQVTDSNGCTVLSNNTYVTLAGIAGVEENGLFSIYPDPANNTLFIKWDGAAINAGDIEVYNVLGEIVLNKRAAHFYTSPLPVDVSALPSGVFFVEIKAGNTNYLKQIIKE